MRKDPNIMLRGATWSLCIAVPVRLQAIRAEQGIRSSKEVWRTLSTGDYKTAKSKAIHVKAEFFREFEEEAQLHAAPRADAGGLPRKRYAACVSAQAL